MRISTIAAALILLATALACGSSPPPGDDAQPTTAAADNPEDWLIPTTPGTETEPVTAIPPTQLVPEETEPPNAEEENSLQPEAREALERARSALADREYALALQELAQARDLNGEPSREIESQVGDAYARMGRPEDAIIHYARALEIQENETDRAKQAQAHLEMGECQEAVENAQAALRLSEEEKKDSAPATVGANIVLSVCYLRQGRESLAAEHADDALDADGRNPTSREKTRELQQHRDDLEAVLDGRIGPEDFLFGHGRNRARDARELMETGRYDDAITALQEAQKVNGVPSGNLHLLTGMAHSALGRHEEALWEYSDAIGIRDSAGRRIVRAREYLKENNCRNAMRDARAALEMKPRAERGNHSEVEAHRIIYTCFLERKKAEEALPHLEQALALARENGYETEAVAEIAGKHEEVRRAVRPRVTELTTSEQARWLEENRPREAEKLAAIPWVRDGMDGAEEEKTLEHLLDILTPAGDEGPNPTDSATAILEMPFLQTHGPGSAGAVRSLRNIALRDQGRLEEILGNESLAEGIRAEQMPNIAALWPAVLYQQPGLEALLLDSRGTNTESRSVKLPSTGRTELRLIRMGNLTGNPETMNELEQAVRQVESFMEAPLPGRMATVLVATTGMDQQERMNTGTVMVLGLEEENAENLQRRLAAGLAQQYWDDNRDWLDRGMAETIAGREGGPTASGYPCTLARNIRDLEKVEGAEQKEIDRCGHALGERLFIDLREQLGEKKFQEGARKLYQNEPEGKEQRKIGSVRKAFGENETIEKWYGNRSPSREEKSLGEIPVWRIDEMDAIIDGIWIKEPGKKEKGLESISSEERQGEIILEIHQVHPKTDERTTRRVKLRMVEGFEDGFAYRETETSMEIPPGSEEATWELPLEPGPNGRWKPGVHRVDLYDWKGVKVAGKRWTVTSLAEREENLPPGERGGKSGEKGEQSPGEKLSK